MCQTTTVKLMSSNKLFCKTLFVIKLWRIRQNELVEKEKVSLEYGNLIKVLNEFTGIIVKKIRNHSPLNNLMIVLMETR